MPPIRNFAKRCLAAFKTDPIGDFIKELLAEGVTEEQLTSGLKQLPRLPEPFKLSLQNRFRDQKLGLKRDWPYL